MSAVIGQPISRVEGRRKVTGAAKYAADFEPAGVVHGVIVSSTIAFGRIAAIDTDAAEAAPGVIAVLTHEATSFVRAGTGITREHAQQLPYYPRQEKPPVDPEIGEQLRMLQSAEILHNGQHIAVVVAATLEQAQHAARLVRVRYDPRRGVTEFDRAELRMPAAAKDHPRAAPTKRGDPDRAWRSAEISVDQIYVQPAEHHNPIELHATIASWEGDRLTLWDKTQWVDNDRAEVAHVFGIPEDNIRVISPFVGGAFGSALRTWPHVMLTALVARQVGRPVKIVVSRRQAFTSNGLRPHTVQRVALGATRDGRLTALIHEARSQTSVYEEYVENTLEPPRMLYSCPNSRTHHLLAPMNVNTPCPMRAPGVVTGNLALEMAMDELAWAAGIDPIELRLRNYAERDEQKDLPWSSKSLRECYRVAAERFGWEKRDPRPGAMRDGRLQIGYGMASASYPTHRAAATASVELLADGSAVVRSAASDMGPGTYTSMTQVAAETLGLPVEKVRFELGDTALPPAPVHGGSITMASVGSAVEAASRACLAKLSSLAGNIGAPPAPERFAELLRQRGLDMVEATASSEPGEEEKKFSMFAFGAVFAEVRVDPELGQVRVPRLVGAYGAGRIVNPKIARSQCIGGMVGGIGMALLEKSEWDERHGRFVNANLAEYLVPVNADVPSLDVTFVAEEEKEANPLGVKGVGEIALVGVAPAIANAVFHATGKRIRELPIRPENLLA